MIRVRPCVAQKAEIDAATTDFPTPPFPLATHREAARTPPTDHAPLALEASAREDSSCKARSRLNSRRAWFQFTRGGGLRARQTPAQRSGDRPQAAMLPNGNAPPKGIG